MTEQIKQAEWRGEAVWSRIAEARHKDRRKLRFVFVLKVAAALTFLLLSIHSIDFGAGAADQYEPVAQLPNQIFRPASLSVQPVVPSRVNQTAPAQAMKERAAKSAIVATADLQVDMTDEIEVKPQDNYTAVTQLPMAVHPIVIPEREPLFGEPGVGQRTVFYLPAPPAEDLPKANVGEILLGFLPFINRKKRFKTQLLIDVDLGLTLSVVRQDSIK